MDDFMSEMEGLASKTAKAKLLDAAPLCAVVLDDSGKVKVANALFIQLMGPVFKYENYSFSEAGANDDAKAKLLAAIGNVRSGASPRERLRNIEMLTLAGDAGLPIKTHFDWFIGPSEEAGEVTLFGDPCSEDILEQRSKDAELIDFFQNAPIALHWLSGTGHVVWANQTELDVLGYTAEEYIGQPIMKFCPDEEELVLEIFKTLGSGNIIKDVPVRFRTKAGKIVPLLIDSNVAYKVDEKGEKAFNHTRCFIRDDTGRRVRDARVEAMLKETERSLKLLDAFVSRTLHLVKTPCHVVQQSLGLLSSNMQALMGRLPKAEAAFFSETDVLLDSAMQQLNDVSGLINDASDVMRFEQGAVLKLCPVALPLKALGRAAVDHAKDASKPKVKVSFEMAAGPAVVSLDAKVLHRALDQLLRNAAEATPSGGSITLKIRHEKAGEKAADGVADGVAGEKARVRFEVCDTGRGLKTSDPSTLFQRYSPGAAPRGSTPPSSTDASPSGTTPPSTPPHHANAVTVAGAVKEGDIEAARVGLQSSLAFSADKTTGLGIGLNLTYGLVRAMGGELRAESSPGNTRFWFVLPVESAHTIEAASTYTATRSDGGGASGLVPNAASPRLAEWARSGRAEKQQRRRNWNSISSGNTNTNTSESESGSTKQRDDDSQSSSTASEQGSPTMEPRVWEEEAPVKKVVMPSCIANTGLKALEAPHVLVVEDTDMCAMIVCMLLKKLGCSTDHAENGQEALDMLKAAEPGLYSMILMDLRMPVMDGFAATKAIKHEMQLKIPVVALTADEGFDTRDKCAAIGFDDFEAKPLHHAALAALIEKHTGHQVTEEAASGA